MTWCAHIPTLAGCVRCGRSDHRCATRDGLCRLCATKDRYAGVRDGRNARRRAREAAKRATTVPTIARATVAPHVAASRARGAARGVEAQRTAAAHRARDRAAVLSNARNEGHGWHPQHEHCVGCGTRVLPHHADGYCRACWRAARGLAGAVELWGEADGDVAWTVEGDE